MYCCISQCVTNFNETFVFIFEFTAALINLEFKYRACIYKLGVCIEIENSNLKSRFFFKNDYVNTLHERTYIC